MDDIVAAHEAVKQAEQIHKQSIAERRLAVLQAKAQGATLREIAAALGISHQRVSKILDGNSPPRSKRIRRVQTYPIEL